MATVKVKNKDWALVLLLIAIPLLLFAKTATFDYINWDDPENVYKNEVFTGPQPLKDIWFSFKHLSYLPLTHTFFYVQWLAGSGSPQLFHGVGVFLHILNILLIFFVLKKLKLDPLPAFFIALLYGLHPARVESVAWITEQKSLLSGVLLWLCFLSYLRYDELKRPLFLAASVVCYALALLAKQTAFPFFLVILAYNYLLRDNRNVRDNLLVGLPLAGVGSGIIYLNWLKESANFAGSTAAAIPLLPRIIIFGRSVIYYVIRTLVPFNVIPIYPRWEVFTDLTADVLPLIALAVLSGAVIRAYRRRDKWLAFCSTAYLLTILPVAGLITIPYMNTSFITDRYLYLPGVFLTIILVRLARQFLPKWQYWLAGFALVCGLATFVHLDIYRGSEAFWAYTMDKNPECTSVYTNLGYYLMHKPDATAKDLVESMRYSGQAITINPNNSLGYYNYGSALFRLGNLKEAEKYLRRALELKPTYADVWNDLGWVLEQQGRIKEAVECYRTALKYKPEMKLFQRNLDRVLKR